MGTSGKRKYKYIRVRPEGCQKVLSTVRIRTQKYWNTGMKPGRRRCPEAEGQVDSSPRQGADPFVGCTHVPSKSWAPLNFGALCILIWLVVWNMVFILHNIWDNFPHWLIFFKMVKTTNQLCILMWLMHLDVGGAVAVSQQSAQRCGVCWSILWRWGNDGLWPAAIQEVIQK